jgi:hypothetical protein
VPAILAKLIERLLLDRDTTLASDVVDDPHNRQTGDVLLDRCNGARPQCKNRNQRNDRLDTCSKFTGGSAVAPGTTKKRTIEKRTTEKTLTHNAHD